MIGKKLKETFDQYFLAPIEVWNYCADFCEIATYKKNQIVKQSGQIEKHCYFFRRFQWLIYPEGKQHCLS
jgi:CRP/FNR family transcriptional regulator, anaerobic regulatory protein